MKFTVGTKLRTSKLTEGLPEGIEFVNPLLRRRVVLSKKDAMKLLNHFRIGTSGESSQLETVLAELGMVNQIASEELRNGIAHWFERNWESSLHYYLWSRKFSFVDDSEDYKSVQRQSLEEDLLDDHLPLPVPAKADGERVDLNKPEPLGADTMGEVFLRRASFPGDFRLETLRQDRFSGVLWHGLQKVRNNRKYDLKADIRGILSHSSGCALDVFIVAYDVQDIENGIYFYDPVKHAISPVRKGSFREQMRHALIGHRGPLTASCTVCLTAEFERFQWRYRHERALRNLYIDTGYIMQSLVLAATAYRLLTHITPAVRDTEALSMLGLSPCKHQVLHTLTLGLGKVGQEAPIARESY